MPSETCPICGSEANATHDLNRNRFAVSCPNCGQFEIGRSAYDDCSKNFSHKRAAIVGHAVLEMQEREETPYLDTSRIKAIMDAGTVPGHVEQFDNLIRFIGRYLDRRQHLGEKVERSFKNLRAATGSIDERDVKYVVEELKGQGFVTQGTRDKNPVFGLTFKGWDRYKDMLARGSAQVAFMAMQYEDKVLDGMFENCFRPAVKDTGFDLRRLDQVLPTGLIDDILRSEIRNARFLLADLTHANPGAYWEGGFAEGLGRPVIYLCEKSKFEGKGTHFDTNHCQTVIWEAGKRDKCAAKLKGTIRATIPGEAKMTDD